MLSTLIIVFREGLEAALVVTIVMAATKGIAGRNLWIGGGMVAGIAGASVVAMFAQTIAMAAQGLGQEVFNAAVLFVAVAMLGWHNIWMTRHGREMAQKATEAGKAVLAGRRPYYVLAVVVGLAVLREGSEVVLLLYGVAASAGEAALGMLFGGLLGLGAAVALGAGLYFGMVRIPLRHLFSVTNWMILLLAAGMAAQGAGFLVQAGLVPALGTAIWDSSWLLSEASLTGEILHTLVGYVARPDGIQVIFYLATLAVIGTLMGWLRPDGTAVRGLSQVTPLLVGMALVFAATPARAAFVVGQPLVVSHEIGLELRHPTPFGGEPGGTQTPAAGYGVSPIPGRGAKK